MICHGWRDCVINQSIKMLIPYVIAIVWRALVQAEEVQVFACETFGIADVTAVGGSLLGGYAKQVPWAFFRER